MATTKVSLAPDFPLRIDPVLQVELPAGYRRVWRGPICPGDYYLDLVEARSGRIVWMPCQVPTAEAVQYNAPYATAAWWGCVIRPGEPVDLPCERCEVLHRVTGWRYCLDCAHEVLREQRPQQQKEKS